MASPGAKAILSALPTVQRARTWLPPRTRNQKRIDRVVTKFRRTLDTHRELPGDRHRNDQECRYVPLWYPPKQVGLVQVDAKSDISSLLFV